VWQVAIVGVLALLAGAVRIDFMPPPYLVGGLLVVLHLRAKRLGDIVAGTVVVRDRPIEQAFATAERRAIPRGEVPLAPVALSDEEFRVLREFKERAWSLACGGAPQPGSTPGPAFHRAVPEDGRERCDLPGFVARSRG
jgi:hypothetical protein